MVKRMKGNYCSFSLSEVSLETVMTAAAKIKKSTRLGPYTIHATLLKMTLPLTCGVFDEYFKLIFSFHVKDCKSVPLPLH